MDALKAAGYNEVVECPYDKSHQILKSRMQRHLVKCKKNHNTGEKMECKFNSTHMVDKREYSYHLETCPDRFSFDLYKYKIDVKPNKFEHSEPTELPGQPDVFVETLEDWSDSNAPTYNPQHYCKQAPVLRTKIGATPSEKKAFRRQENERLKNVDN